MNIASFRIGVPSILFFIDFLQIQAIHISGNIYTTTQLTLFRYTITALRNLGLSAILPLDNNIFIHKVIGTLIFVQAWCHTIMHLINFGVNVQPDPLKFVQINSEYWNWKELGYNMPTGCRMENENSSSSFKVQVLGQSNYFLIFGKCIHSGLFQLTAVTLWGMHSRTPNFLTFSINLPLFLLKTFLWFLDAILG